MLLARDAGPAPAPGNMAALTLKIFKTALPGDSNPGPAPLCPEAKKAALCIPTFGNVVVVVVVDIGSWVLPLPFELFTGQATLGFAIGSVAIITNQNSKS